MKVSDVKFYKQSSTHFPLLIKCVLATDGPILEMGTGIFSTPLLHWLASEKKRWVFSYEDNPEWFRLAKKFQSITHRIRLVEDWSKLNLKGHWSVALIDQSTKSRTPMAIYLKDKVDYIVIHDTDAEHHYNYEKVWPHFKYRFDSIGHPRTSVISNFQDLKWLGDKTL